MSRRIPIAAILVMWAWSGGLFAAETIGRPPLPPGQHPRLLCTQDDLGRLRQLAQTPTGRACIEQLRTFLSGGQSGEFLKHLVRNDPRWRREVCGKDWLGIKAVSGNFPLGQLAWYAAVIYQATGDARDGLAATETFRLAVEAYPENPAPTADAWGYIELAFAYDLLYNDLDPASRDHGRRILASYLGAPTRKVFDTAFWLGGGIASGRHTSNWTPIFAASVGVTALAIEGEEGWNPEIAELCARYMRESLLNGIAPDGAMYEGTGYGFGGMGGWERGPVWFVETLRRRGVDLYATTHWPRVGEWAAYEILPWGYEAQNINKSMGRFGPAALIPGYLAWRGGPLNSWLWHNFNRPDADPGQPDPLLGLLLGQPRWNGERPDQLPLCRWFAPHGMVYCRSGWGERDADFIFCSNPLAAGHTHSDYGSFCLAANGANFISDEEVLMSGSQYHNLVFSDGKAEEDTQCGGVGVEAYIRAVESNTLADLIDCDLTRAYSFALDGLLAGTSHWREYNPVERAERRALFVRGASGPLVVIADDFCKDQQAHEYDWQARTEANNVLTVDGRAFRIAERFGGRYFHSLKEGAKSTLVAHHVPGGTYHGWALVRGEPAPFGWSSNTFIVNGKTAPYDTSFFGRDYHLGWQWNPILPGNKAEIVIPDGGDITLDYVCGTGGRVAVAVFTRNPKWEPGDGPIPSTGGDFQVLTAADAQPGSNAWDIAEAPKGVLDGLFLGKDSPTLSMTRMPQTNRRVLHAKQKTIAASFLTVLVPHDENDGRTVSVVANTDNQLARVTSPAGTDLVAGQSTQGEVTTDGATALISLGKDAALRGYALVEGRQLAYRGQTLAQAAGQAVHVLNDGQRLVVRGPGGASVTCLRLGATTLVVNGAESKLPAEALAVAPIPAPESLRSLPQCSARGQNSRAGAPPTAAETTATGAVALQRIVKIRVPALPLSWQIDIAKDGSRVVVTGDGPQPCAIRGAPDANEVDVNGVSRYFVKDKAGVLYPTLSAGTTIFPVRDRLQAADLHPTGKLAFAVPTAGPGRYRFVLGCRAAQDGEVTVWLDGKPAGPKSRLPASEVVRLAFDHVKVTATTVSLNLQSASDVAVLFLDVHPEFAPIRSENWSVIGPVDNGGPDDLACTSEGVKPSMARVYPPEQKINLQATIKTAGGRQLHWSDGRKFAGAEGVPLSKLLDFPRLRVCYAVSYIRSPAAREARLDFACDFWANVWLNGQRLVSDRPPAAAAEDGAQFATMDHLAAPLRLKKGVNVLLVKCRGGMGSNSFVASITDPGDLRFAPRP